jgi:hypothetical protein
VESSPQRSRHDAGSLRFALRLRSRRRRHFPSSLHFKPPARGGREVDSVCAVIRVVRVERELQYLYPR